MPSGHSSARAWTTSTLREPGAVDRRARGRRTCAPRSRPAPPAPRAARPPARGPESRRRRRDRRSGGAARTAGSSSAHERVGDVCVDGLGRIAHRGDGRGLGRDAARGAPQRSAGPGGSRTAQPARAGAQRRGRPPSHVKPHRRAPGARSGRPAAFHVKRSGSALRDRAERRPGAGRARRPRCASRRRRGPAGTRARACARWPSWRPAPPGARGARPRRPGRPGAASASSRRSR